MRSFETELGLGACPAAQKKCFSLVAPNVWAAITAIEMVRNASTRRPRAGRRLRVVVNMVISAGNSPKVLLKLQGASVRRARACIGHEEFTAGYGTQYFRKLTADLFSRPER